jgi:hypothetical protein
MSALDPGPLPETPLAEWRSARRGELIRAREAMDPDVLMATRLAIDRHL